MFLKLSLVIGILSGVIGRTTPQPSGSPYCIEGHCYIRPEINKKSWAEAQQTCKKYNLSLAIADNTDHQRNVEAAIYHFMLNHTDPVWLGANASDSGPNNWRWLDGTQYSGTGVQNSGSYTRSYAFLSKTAATVIAYASEPAKSYSYICQYNKNSAATCTNGTGRLAFLKESRCYVKYDEKLTWFNARNNCSANNGDLASFSDFSLLDGVVDANGSWVGLRHSQWTWHNAVTGLSSDVIFTSWLSGEPDDPIPVCLCIDNVTFPRWRDRICSHEVSYICEVFDTTWPTYTTPATSSINSITSATPATASVNYIASHVTSSTPTSSDNATDPNCPSCSSNESQGNDQVFAVGLGIGIPCVIIIIALIVIVIVQRRQLRKFERYDEKLKSGRTVVADSSEHSTTSSTSVLKSVEHEPSPPYQHLQNRSQLQDQPQYDKLRENNYEQL